MIPEVLNERLAMPMPSGSSSTPKSALAGRCSEIQSGSLTMVGCSAACGRATELRVIVKVYRTTLEHFAVLYPEKAICKPLGYINLKNCSVECLRNNSRALQIIQKSCDGGVLTFRADTPLECKTWLDTFQNKAASTKMMSAANRRMSADFFSVSLPILEEDDEE